MSWFPKDDIESGIAMELRSDRREMQDQATALCDLFKQGEGCVRRGLNDKTDPIHTADLRKIVKEASERIDKFERAIERVLENSEG